MSSSDFEMKCSRRYVSIPFDDSAVERQRRMGFLKEDDSVDYEVLAALCGVYAGQYFDDLCDHCQSAESVQGILRRFIDGRGETYSLELGSDLSRAITSELAMLATPQTLPLFLNKYQKRQVKLYRRREPVYKGMGDIICCLDESGSTRGDLAAWGKSAALALLEIAEESGRRFALIHFSGSGSLKTDLFLPGRYGTEDKLRAAETFLGGGTNYETPLREAIRLMEFQKFEKADIVFITDGECALPQGFMEELQASQAVNRFTVTGILLDKGAPGMEFSLKEFCQNIYRTSEFLAEDIFLKLVSERT